jgi:hypothetical protein
MATQTLQEILNQQNSGLSLPGTRPPASTTVGGITPLPKVNPILSGYGFGTGQVIDLTKPTIPSGLNDGKTYPNYMTGSTLVPVVPQTTTPTPVVPTTVNTTQRTNTNTGTRTPAPTTINPTPAAYNPLTGQPLLSGQTATKDGINYIGTSTAPTVPGSAAEIAKGTGYTYTQSPQEIADEARRVEAQNYLESGYNIDVNPDTIYQNKLKEYQAQIDSINNVYADQLAQARVQGQGRIESRQFAQGRAGQIGSGTGEAGINAVQDANRQVENSIMAEKANAIASIYGKVRAGAAEDLAAKTKAKKEGADAILAEGIAKKERRAKRLKDTIAGLISQNVDISEMTDAEIKSYIDGLGTTDDEFIKEFNTQRQTVDLAATKAKQEEEKRQLDLKKTEADINKVNSDVVNWGKMTDYQKAQIAIDRYKAYNPTGTTVEKKGSALGKIASELNSETKLPDGVTPVLDSSGYITPEGYKYMVQNAPQLGVTKQDVLETFGQFLYRDPKNGYASYQLTGADEKLLTAVTPSQ